MNIYKGAFDIECCTPLTKETLLTLSNKICKFENILRLCHGAWLTVADICKPFLSRTNWAISTKLGIKHPFVKGIQVNSNEVPCPFPRGDKSTFIWLKSSSPEPMGQFQQNLAQNILEWREFKCTAKGPFSSQ